MGTELWHPDILVTDNFAKKIIAEQFKHLAPIREINCIGEGWDNKVFLVNNNLIFRFPHRKIAAALIERENVVLKNLQSFFALDIPNPIYVGKPSNDYPCFFHGYPSIQGTSCYHANLTMDDRIKSIIPLADFLKKLHSFSEAQAIKIGAKPQVYNRTDKQNIIKSLNERIVKINKKGITTINKRVFQQEVATIENTLLPTTKVLVHGDLYSRHMLFHQKKLTGIIDWGDVGINNPSVDLAVVFSFYPPEAQQKFLNIYGEVESETWKYARFLGLHRAITMMLYGHDIEDNLLVTESFDAMKRINPAMLENHISY